MYCVPLLNEGISIVGVRRWPSNGRYRHRNLHVGMHSSKRLFPGCLDVDRVTQSLEIPNHAGK